ncbi:MAG: DUF1800 domain-containing protein [Pyrinomonadaceae bacterium]
MKLNTSRPVLDKFFAFFVIAAFLLPCVPVGAMSPKDKKSLSADEKIIHILDRLGYGARPGDIERVRAIGLSKYIEQQLDPLSIDDSAAERRFQNIETNKMTTAEIFARYPNPGALLQMLEGGQNAQRNPEEMNEKERQERQRKLREYYAKYDLRPANQLLPQITSNRILRAVYSERQLNEVMVDFWQNHFNVFAGKGAVRWYIPSYERDVLRKYALGNFKDLVVATAQHPAMLFYLDNFESVAPNQGQPAARPGRLQQLILNGQLTPQMRERIKENQGLTDAQLDQRIRQARNIQQQPRRGLNENYARELMELHTLGVDGGYTQKDIVEVARAFTGWTIADPRGYRRAAAANINGTEEMRLARLQRQAGIPDNVESGEFYFNQNWHDRSGKVVLGQKIDEGGVKDGLKVIDILVSHPSTAKHIARKLAVKFVNDKPSEELIGRVASAFTRSKGDMKATLRALFTDKEFFARDNFRAKIKTPFELAISSIRAIGADTNAGPQMLAMLNKLGEVPYGYQAPTGYPDTSEDWVNAGALLERLNFAIALSSNQIPGTRADLKRFRGSDKAGTINMAVEEILHGNISPATKTTLLKQAEQPLQEVKAPADPADDSYVPNMRQGQAGAQGRQMRLLRPSGDPDVFKVVSLVLGTPEFQRQ